MSKYKTPKPYLGYTTLPDVKTTERMKVDGKMRNLRLPVAKSADFEKLHAFADESTALLEKRNADPILNNITVPHTPSKSEYSFTSKALSNYQPWENDPRLETLGQTIDDNNSKLQRREGLVKEAEKRIREHRKNLFELNLKYPNTDIAKLLSPKIQEKLDKDISVYQQYYDDYSTLYTETTGIVDKYNSILGKEKERRTAWESTVMPIEELLDFYDSYVGEGSSNKRLLNDPIATPEQKERARAEIDLYTSQLGDSLYLFTQSEDFKNMGDLTDDERGKLRKEIKNLPILGSIWDLMNTPSFYITDDELKTYKYLKKLDRYNERTAANGFIEYMMPIWEARAVQGGAEKIEALPAVIEQGAKLHNAFGSGLYSWGQGVYSYLTGEQADPTIAQRIHQTTTANASAPGKVIYSLTESAGNLLPSILLSKGAGMLSSASSAKKGIDTIKAADRAAKIGKAVGGVSMGLSAAGNAYSEKLAEGWGKDKARAYSTIVGISEVTLGNVLGGITAVGGGKISAKAASKINAIRRTTPRIAAKLAVTGLSEATEEGLQTLLEPLYSGIINNEKYTAPSAEEVLISAASGFLLGDVMEFGTTVSADRNQALDTDIVNEYIEKGKKAEPGTVSRIMSDKISGILAENPDAKFSARDIGIIARMSKGDAKLKKNSKGTDTSAKDTKVQGSDIANLFTPSEEVAPNAAKPSPAEAPAVPGANAEGVTTTLPETNAESVIPSDPNINLSTDAVTANTQTVKKFNYETPTVSRDGIEIKSESDPEIQKRLEGVTDDIERSGILSGASDDTISTVKRLSEDLNTKILFEITPVKIDKDGVEYYKNGRYDPNAKTIYINMAGSASRPYQQLISHEFLHSVEGTDLHQVLRQYAEKNIKNFDNQVIRKKETYNNAGENISQREAENEVIAEYVANNLLNDYEHIKALVKSNRSLGEKIKSIIDKILSLIGKGKIKTDAETRVMLRRANKYYNSLLSTQAKEDTSGTADIKAKLDEIIQKKQSGTISEKEYNSQILSIDREAQKSGIDISEMLGSNSKNDISSENSKKESINSSEFLNDVNKKTQQILDHLRSDPKKERIAKLFQKSFENSKNKITEHKLPRNSYLRLRDAEKLLSKEIADAFFISYKRLGELFYPIRALTSEYMTTGKISKAVIKDIARTMNEKLNVKITETSMLLIREKIHKVVESELKYVKEVYDYMLKEANKEPIEVKQSRLEKGYRVVEMRIHEFRDMLLDELSIDTSEKHIIDDLIYKLLSKAEDGTLPPAYVNDFFDKIFFYTKNAKAKETKSLTDWLQHNFSIKKQNSAELQSMTHILLTSYKTSNFDANITAFLNAIFLAGTKTITSDTELYLFFKNAKIKISDEIKRKILERGEIKNFSSSVLKTRDDGISIEEMYDFLHAWKPEVFPENIFTDIEQAEYLMSISNELKPKKYSIDDLMTQEEKTKLFKKAKSKIRETAAKFYAEKDIINKKIIYSYASDLARDVMFATNYATDTATRAQSSTIESIDTTADQVKSLYENLKKEREKMLFARGKAMLTQKDESALREILSGSKSINELPSDYNIKDIAMVYEASIKYEKIKKEVEEYRNKIINQRRELAEEILFDGDLTSGFADHSIGLLYMMNTMERNFEFIGKRADVSNRLKDTYLTPIHESSKKMILRKNRIVEKIEKLDLSREIAKGNTDSESFAVQFVGEAEETIRYLSKPENENEKKSGMTKDEWQYLLDSFWKENPNIDKKKISNAVKVFRTVYQELFNDINTVRARNGYEPIDYRSGYFPHFNPQKREGFITAISQVLGVDTESDNLPTEINGLTHLFRPSIPYQGSAKARSENLQFETTFDAIEGLHRYLDSALKVIYLTDNIGNLRALAQQIRYRSSDKGTKEEENKIRYKKDLTEEERQEKIDNLYKDSKYKLSNFVVNLEEFTNILAGKKSQLDRNAERFFGRGIYKLGRWLSNRISSNMVVGNISSALSNFLPLTQAISDVGLMTIVKAAKRNIKSGVKNDGLDEMSDFLVGRRGAEDLLKRWQLTHTKSNSINKHRLASKIGKSANTALGKTLEAGSLPMETIDYMVSKLIVRAYNMYYLEQGMSETDAIKSADEKARRIIADRSIGSMPTLFNATNPIIKLFTQFQLEVTNQIAYFYHDVMQLDVPKEERDKQALKIALEIFKYCIAAYLFNDLYEKLMGRRPALDPLGIFNDAVGNTTGVHIPNVVDTVVYLATDEKIPPWETQKMPLENAISDFTSEVLQEIPIVGSVFGGGRLPSANALPDIGGAIKTALSDASPEKKKEKIKKELDTIGTYLILPGGGGQIAKTAKGISTLSQKGDYTVDKEGRKKLKYPITSSVWNVPRAVLFGPTSTDRGQEWIKTNFSNTLSYKETSAYQAIVNEGLPLDNAYDLMHNIKNSGDLKKDKVKELNSSDIPQRIKRVAYKEMFLPDSKKVILSALNDIGDYEDVVIDFMLEHPEANSQKEIMAIWGDVKNNGHLLMKDKTLTQREKAAIIQVVADAKENPYWTKLKESVYYVVHPEEKIEDEERERENQKKKRR